jgi:hypothetical protein
MPRGTAPRGAAPTVCTCARPRGVIENLTSEVGHTRRSDCTYGWRRGGCVPASCIPCGRRRWCPSAKVRQHRRRRRRGQGVSGASVDALVGRLADNGDCWPRPRSGCCRPPASCWRPLTTRDVRGGVRGPDRPGQSSDPSACRLDLRKAEGSQVSQNCVATGVARGLHSRNLRGARGVPR